jgi:hypothetical protein
MAHSPGAAGVRRVSAWEFTCHAACGNSMVEAASPVTPVMSGNGKITGRSSRLISSGVRLDLAIRQDGIEPI